MSSTEVEREEKKRIFAWAKKHDGESMLLRYNKSKNDTSYFNSFDNDDNCIEYGFDSMPELKKQLEKMWEKDTVMQEIILPCMVATFKGRPKHNEVAVASEATSTSKTEKAVIPEFVYAF